MRRLIITLFVPALIMLGYQAIGQVSQTTFSPANSKPVLAKEQNGIQVFYKQGTIGKQSAICLGFKNLSNKKLVFTWVLKDGQGNIMTTGQAITLEGGQSLDLSNPVLKNKLTFGIKSGMTASEYKTEITLKN